MRLKLFAVVDRISGVWDGPHKAINEGQFLRSFADECRKKPMSEHPEDFYCAELGTYDDATGEIKGLEEGPLRIADATDFIRRLNDEEK